MRIDIEEVEKLLARLREINALPLESIEFYKDGKRLEIAQAVFDEWRVTGLSNAAFVDFGEYAPEE